MSYLILCKIHFTTVFPSMPMHSDVTRGNAASPGSVTTTLAGSVTTTLVATRFMRPDTVYVCQASQRITISSKLKRIVFEIGKKKKKRHRKRIK